MTYDEWLQYPYFTEEIETLAHETYQESDDYQADLEQWVEDHRGLVPMDSAERESLFQRSSDYADGFAEFTGR